LGREGARFHFPGRRPRLTEKSGGSIVLEIARMPTVGDIVRRNAAARREAVAIHYEDQTITYGDLDRRSNQVANALTAAGIRSQARVAVLAKNGPAFFELWFGAAKAGAVLVPVNFRLAPPEIAYVINDAGAELLFVGADFYRAIGSIAGQLESVRAIVALDGDHPEWPDYAEWSARGSTADPALPIRPSDCAVQMYTSGTTGHPKGAQLSHANLLTLLPGALRQFGSWNERDVSLVCMPLFHIGGSGWALVGLYAGARNVLAREFDPPAILRLMERFDVTKAFFVPAMILFLLQAPQCAGTDFSALDLIVYGASPAPIELLRDALKTLGCGFAQVYGLTETTGAITYLPPEDHGEDAGERLKSCGKPMAGVEIKIVDAAGSELPPDEVGEVVCRTPQIMLGYWNLPDATKAAIRDDWLYTGDAGYLDRAGYLYIYDRVKDMIISGGENIYPAEVENALFGHPAIADVAVIGVPDDQWGESVKAVVVRKPGTEVSAEDLIGFARQRIAGYKVPKSIDFADALPRNPSGKILKRELRKPYWAHRDRQVH
jgi:long-chain acyl-CoA synthetase